MSADQNFTRKLAEEMRNKRKTSSQVTAVEPVLPPRVKTPEYISNFGPRPDINSRPSKYGEQGSSNFKSESLVRAEDMMDVEDTDNHKNGGDKQQQQQRIDLLAPAATGSKALFPYYASNTALDLRYAIKTLYENQDYYAASCIRLLARKMYPLEFEELLLTVHGVPRDIPAQAKTICGNRDALEYLEKAYKNAGAIEGSKAARMVKMAIEEVYGVGVMDGIVAAWEEANGRTMK